MLVETRYEHVVLNEQGTPTVVGTTWNYLCSELRYL